MVTLILAWRRQRQADLHEFEVSLVNKVSSRTTRAVTQRNLVLGVGGVTRVGVGGEAPE